MVGSNAELSFALAGVVDAVGPSVVRVEGGHRRSVTGVVWAPGRVLTVAHTLDPQAQLKVTGADGVGHRAQVKGLDVTTDLALLEVDGALTPARFDDGAQVKVGHAVLRLGRPGETVRATFGIVSAVGSKAFQSAMGGTVDRYLEADAAHRPGFSGGPLVTLDGAVLGLTSTALVRSVVLSIPHATLARVAAQLEAHGRMRRSYLGLNMQPVRLPEAEARATGEEVGLLVMGVEPGGPADAAGLTYGDTILHLGDASVRTVEDVWRYLRADHVGETTTVKFLRGGAVHTTPLTLGARP